MRVGVALVVIFLAGCAEPPERMQSIQGSLVDDREETVDEIKSWAEASGYRYSNFLADLSVFIIMDIPADACPDVQREVAQMEIVKGVSTCITPDEA